MKFLIICFLFWSPAFSQGDIYSFNIRTPDGGEISMAHYKGRKILIISVTPDNLKIRNINFLDSLQKNIPGLAIILIPANDLGETFDDSKIQGVKGSLLKTLSRSFIISTKVRVKKSEAQNQDPLLQWLTHSDQNTHFNADVTTNEQMYVISESGILYAVLEKGVPLKVINEVLKQKDVKQ